MAVSANRIVLKSPREVELLRAAGGVVGRVLDEIGEMIRPGITTAELDARAAELIEQAGATPLFKGVRNSQARMPFPACICASVNEVVVHGIPDGEPLDEGDIVSVDCGVRLQGYCGDSARTFGVGRLSPTAQRLLNVTAEALSIALDEMAPGVRWGQVAKLLQKHVERAGFGVVREFVGHGIGQEMHEEPKVPNYYDRSQRGMDFELRPGMTLAIEPMVTAGQPGVGQADGTGWAIVTQDGSLAAHFEHSVAVTGDGVTILTGGR